MFPVRSHPFGNDPGTPGVNDEFTLPVFPFRHTAQVSTAPTDAPPTALTTMSEEGEATPLHRNEGDAARAQPQAAPPRIEVTNLPLRQGLAASVPGYLANTLSLKTCGNTQLSVEWPEGDQPAGAWSLRYCDARDLAPLLDDSPPYAHPLARLVEASKHRRVAISPHVTAVSAGTVGNGACECRTAPAKAAPAKPLAAKPYGAGPGD